MSSGPASVSMYGQCQKRHIYDFLKCFGGGQKICCPPFQAFGWGHGRIAPPGSGSALNSNGEGTGPCAPPAPLCAPLPQMRPSFPCRRPYGPTGAPMDINGPMAPLSCEKVAPLSFMPSFCRFLAKPLPGLAHCANGHNVYLWPGLRHHWLLNAICNWVTVQPEMSHNPHATD